MAENPPEWAYNRAVELLDAFRCDAAPGSISEAYADLKGAFALYIASTEEPPFYDEAVRLIGEVYGPTHHPAGGGLMLGDGPARVEAIKQGKAKDYWEVRLAIAALKRGIELAKSPDALARTEGGVDG